MITPQNITKAVLINNSTGERFELEKRKGSYCHFLKDNDGLSYDKNLIRFRLDWGDLNEYGDPSLDADIIDSNGKQYKERIEAHHTEKLINANNGVYAYHFTQDSIDIIFSTELVKQVTIQGTARIIQNPSSE